jgi:hypothetical protein
LEELESLITITENDEFLAEKSIKTPVFDGDIENHIICASNDMLSDEHNEDNSCLMMLEREW